jgi:hypothetical protein
MYKTCPKCGHNRAPSSNQAKDRCPQCGLVYRKWFNRRFRKNRIDADFDSAAGDLTVVDRLRELFLGVKPETSRTAFYARCLVFLVLLVWGWKFIGMDYYYLVEGVRINIALPEIYQSFLHNVNLIFHEAGHVLFLPFGRFMSILGGSLMQILMPLTVMLVFLLKERNTFGAAVGLWWTAQSLMDVAPYINDARAGQIPLLGGGTGVDRPGMHDWRNILSELDMLSSDYLLAGIVDGLGTLLMLTSLVWGALVLFQQYKNF